jgi:hypothetical protein
MWTGRKRVVMAIGLASFFGGCGSEATPPVVETGDAAREADDDPGKSPTGDGNLGMPPDAAESGFPACSPFVTNVVRVDYGPGAGFGQSAYPSVVEGPPRGGGCCRGSLHVLSLGDGGNIVVEFGQVIVDGPGADFIVFENPFDIGADPLNPNADPATVEVSADGAEWFAFPCSATGYPWGACAGWHPVFANPEANAIDPLDPGIAGGDPFDLADLAADGGPTEVKYVRITDRPDVVGDFDLDALGVVHGRCR